MTLTIEPTVTDVSQSPNLLENAKPSSLLDDLLTQVPTLNLQDLLKLREAVEMKLATIDEAEKMEAFGKAMLAAGLITKIKYPVANPVGDHRAIPIQGKPLSETIIEERI